MGPRTDRRGRIVPDKEFIAHEQNQRRWEIHFFQLRSVSATLELAPTHPPCNGVVEFSVRRAVLDITESLPRIP